LESGVLEELPPPSLMEMILTRDASDFNVEESDNHHTTEAKKKARECFDVMFDFYVDRMLATVAGKKMWGPDIKYTEEVSKSLIPKIALPRITPSTEAFAVLVYSNCRNKWNQMHMDRKAHRENKEARGKFKCPRFNKKTGENPEYATPFTDSASGQKKVGGYTDSGIDEFVRLQKMLVQEQQKPDAKDRFSMVERASILRLREKYNIVP